MLLCAIEIANVIPKTSNAFNNKFSGFTLVSLGKYLAFVIFRILSIPIATTKVPYLVKANTRLCLHPYISMSAKVRYMILVFFKYFANAISLF